MCGRTACTDRGGGGIKPDQCGSQSRASRAPADPTLSSDPLRAARFCLAPYFFDVANHPQVRFEADAATLDGDTLTGRGMLSAAGQDIPLDVAGPVTPVDYGFEIEATALADHRELGMTWSPLGTLRAPSKLIVRGRLIRTENVR